MELVKALLLVAAYLFLAVMCIRASIKLERAADAVLDSMDKNGDIYPCHPDYLRYKRYRIKKYAQDALSLLAIYFTYQEVQNVLHLIAA